MQAGDKVKIKKFKLDELKRQWRRRDRDIPNDPIHNYDAKVAYYGGVLVIDKLEIRPNTNRTFAHFKYPTPTPQGIGSVYGDSWSYEVGFLTLADRPKHGPCKNCSWRHCKGHTNETG